MFELELGLEMGQLGKWPLARFCPVVTGTRD